MIQDIVKDARFLPAQTAPKGENVEEGSPARVAWRLKIKISTFQPSDGAALSSCGDPRGSIH